jgi:hypothetical protein
MCVKRVRQEQLWRGMVPVLLRFDPAQPKLFHQARVSVEADSQPESQAAMLARSPESTTSPCEGLRCGGVQPAVLAAVERGGVNHRGDADPYVRG